MWAEERAGTRVRTVGGAGTASEEEGEGALALTCPGGPSASAPLTNNRSTVYLISPGGHGHGEQLKRVTFPWTL